MGGNKQKSKKSKKTKGKKKKSTAQDQRIQIWQRTPGWRTCSADLLNNQSAYAFVDFFTLNTIDVAQLGALRRVFKQYRIKKVTMSWYPVSSNTAAAGNTSLCTLYTATNVGPETITPWVGSAVPPNPADAEKEALAVANLRTKKLFGRYNITNATHTHTVYPRLQVPVVTASGQVAALAPRGTWVDVDNPDARYQGIKSMFMFENTHSEVSYKNLINILIEFRGVV